VNYVLHPPRGAGRRAVIAVGTAGLVVTGVFIAGSTDSPPARPRPVPQAAKLAGAGPAAERAGLGAVVKLAGPGAIAAGTRLLGQAATATRAVPYRAVQVISWLAPGSSAAWLGSGRGRVTVDVSHRTGQPPDVVLGLSPTLVGLLDAHYVAVYTGQGSAAGRPASVVEVCRPDGSVAARFWLDDATKLPLRRELFGIRANPISVDGLAALKIVTGAARTARQGSTSARAPAAVSQRRTGAGNRSSAAMSMGGFAGGSLAMVGPAATQAPTPSHPTATPASTGTGTGAAGPWTDRLGRAQLAALRTGGWPVPAAMPGGLTLFGASETGTGPGRVVDLAYSDGLSVISLFLQRGQLPTALRGWRQTELAGHPVYLRNPAEPDVAWSAGGYVYTVVAGAPAAVIASVVHSLSHQGRPGFWGRMDRGMRRVLSWINPFR
jgi:hypothetical protein